MKKQRFFMLGIITVLVAVLSLTFVSSTFARYTTSGSGEDSARVAKWGVSVTVDAEEAFGEKYEDAISATGTKVVSSVSGQDVLAPGTEGQLASISIEGTPEVMVSISATFELTLTGWQINSEEYCPLVFTVNATEFKKAADETVEAFANRVEAAVIAILKGENIAANTDLARSVTITWEWAFDGDHAKDTALGNLATAPTIAVEYSATVDQVN